MELFTDKEEFLKQQYKTPYAHIFKTYEKFVEKMESYAISCIHCGVFYWKGCDVPCGCEYKLMQQRDKYSNKISDIL